METEIKDNKVDKRQLVKAVTSAICGAGAWEVLSNAIKGTTPSGIGFISKLGVSIGTIVLGSMLSDKVTEYTDNQVDNVFDAIQKSKEEEETVEAEEMAS